MLGIMKVELAKKAMPWRQKAWLGMAWLGLVWHGMAWFGLAWLVLVWLGALNVSDNVLFSAKTAFFALNVTQDVTFSALEVSFRSANEQNRPTSVPYKCPLPHHSGRMSVDSPFRANRSCATCLSGVA